MTTPVIRAALERLLHDLIEGKMLDGAIADADAALAEQPVGPTPLPGDAEGLAEVFWGRYAQPPADGKVEY